MVSAMTMLADQLEVLRHAVAIPDPRDPDVAAAVVWVPDAAVVTVAAGGASVTVVGPDPETARAHAESALALGADGPAWTLGLDGYEALTILADRTLLMTPGFPALEDPS